MRPTMTTTRPGRTRRAGSPASLRTLGLALAVALVPLAGTADPGQEGGTGLAFQQGPGKFPIRGSLAEIELADGYAFLDDSGTRRLMELTQNPVSGRESATIIPTSESDDWFLVFEWDEMGYVQDDQADLDAEALLDSIREGTAASNAEREKRGWPRLEIVGWQEPPRYDPDTHNLTWSVIGESDGHRSVNRIVKLLGRRGVMTATLVADPDQLVMAMPQVDALLDDFRFQPGSTYAEFIPGTDRMAEIGLGALVVGGAGAALVKSGLLARMWKFIVAGVVALGAGIKRFFTGTRAEEQPRTQV